MPSAPNRGEIWAVDLDPTIGHEQAKTRPCLVISDDRLNHGRAEIVIIIPITSKDRRNPFHVRVSAPEGGLDNTSFIMCEAIRSVSILRIKDRWGEVRPNTLSEVEDRLRIVLGL